MERAEIWLRLNATLEKLLVSIEPSELTIKLNIRVTQNNETHLCSSPEDIKQYNEKCLLCIFFF